MSAETPAAGDRWHITDVVSVLARCLLGALFIYMGLTKALHPVEFLKLMRQYDVLHDHLWLNLVASALPWFEVFCGLLLVLGLAVRGTALTLTAMLSVFTVLVLLRALAVQQAGGLPFCAIKFDCGCGAGEVPVCRKLAENVLLAALSFWLLFRQRNRLSLRPDLL